MEYSNYMNDIYKSIEEYNPTKKQNKKKNGNKKY